jgi:NADH-quinone oxidoreductase subunit H
MQSGGTYLGFLPRWNIFIQPLAFLIFGVSAFAETNRLPFDMPEAESELVGGFHTEYSAMKYAMYPMAEYAHMVTSSALMATLFLGGWDIPFWSGDDAFLVDGVWIRGYTEAGEPIAASLAVWKSMATFIFFGLKTSFFCLVYIWVRWTVPRFRYDQIMHLGWKVVLPAALTYIVAIGATILVLDQVGLSFGFLYGVALTAVSLVATGAFLFVVDRDRLLSGSAAPPERGVEKAVEATQPSPAAVGAGD